LTARTLIITTGALFALAAPAAQASLDRILPAKTQFATHHKIVAKNHKVAAKTSTANHKADTGPLYIYVPGTPNQASSAPSADDCANTGNNCTNQQLCDIWGENCDLVGAMTNSAPPVESAPVVSSSGTDQSTAAPVNSSASAGSSAGDPSTGSDPATTDTSGDC